MSKAKIAKAMGHILDSMLIVWLAQGASLLFELLKGWGNRRVVRRIRVVHIMLQVST